MSLECHCGHRKLVSVKELITRLNPTASIYEVVRKAGTENYPASRDVVEIDIWRSEFLKMRIDSGAQEASVVRDFTRQSKKLQVDGIVHSYSGMVWFVYDEDRQDI